MTRRFLTPLSIDHIDFNLENPSTYAEGRLWWNAEEGTLDLGMTSDVSQSVGMEFYMPPSKNNSGVLIPNGSFVMATGAQGDRITIAKAVSDGSIDPRYMIGVATTDIENGAENGLITTNGIVRDINTSLWPVGTVLYPNSSSAGMLSASAGIAPAIRTPIAIVLRQHSETGRIYVRMQVGHNFGEIESDVKISSLSNGDVLTYSSSEGVWKNIPQTVIVASGSEYPTSSVVNGQLFYNTTNGRTAIYFDSIWKEFQYYPSSIDGGFYNTVVFDDAIDGGSPDTFSYVGSYDGGSF